MLGILGLGNYSTLHYIQRLNEEYNKIHGGYSTCPFIMLNTDFDKINNFLPNQFEKLIPRVRQEIEKLNDMGVSKILIPNITLHETIDKLDFSEEIKNKIIHPLANLHRKVLSANKVEVLILGSLYTMESDYISKSNSLNCVVPDQSTCLSIDELRQDVYKMDVKKKHIDYLQKILVHHYSNVVVMACTELSIVYSKMEKQDNVIDLVEEQIQAALHEI